MSTAIADFYPAARRRYAETATEVACHSWPMPTERDEEQAAVDEAIERESHHEKTRDAAAEQGLIEKVTREDSDD